MIQLDDGASGGGFSAAGLTYQTEDLSLANIEADIINGLCHEITGLKILAEVLDPQQGFLIIHFQPPFSGSFWRYGP